MDMIAIIISICKPHYASFFPFFFHDEINIFAFKNFAITYALCLFKKNPNKQNKDQPQIPTGCGKQSHYEHLRTMPYESL